MSSTNFTPAWCTWLTVETINLGCGILSLMAIRKMKSFGSSTSLLMRVLLITDILMSTFFLFYDTYQLVQSTSNIRIAFNTFTCYCFASLQWLLIGYSQMITFMISLDRLFAILHPDFYKTSFSEYTKSFIIGPLIISIISYVASFFDIFDTRSVDVCTVRRSAGKIYKYFFVGFSLSVNLATSLSYFIMIFHVKKFGAESRSTQIQKIKSKRMKKLAKVLAFSCLCYTMTNFAQTVIMSVAVKFYPDELSPYGIYCGWLSSMDSIIIFASFYIFMPEFKNRVDAIIINRNRIQQVTTLNVGTTY
uniref:G-protein coupled receptors family 1 profile domain-containing protein n=1 Tax=Romanomermis culicivorax TaxID=13658 RepID=A0A915IG17_ROMCU